jgi:hypothetical protein
MRDNGLPHFRPGENRDAEMAEQLEVLAAQECERVYQKRLRLVAQIDPDYESHLADELEESEKRIDEMERARDCGDADEWDNPTSRWAP